MTETGQVVRDIVIKNRKEKSERDRATAFRKGRDTSRINATNGQCLLLHSFKLASRANRQTDKRGAAILQKRAYVADIDF